MRKATRPPHPRPHLRALRLLRARAGGLRLLRARAGGLRLALAAPAALSALLAVGLFSTGAAARTKPFKLPRIRHVFVIMLENEGYEATFGMPASDPYLAKTLPSEGALLTQYYATGHESNDNYVTLVSGQPPNPDNQADCQDFSAFPLADVNSEGVQEGIGCVYPQEVQNVGTQLSAAKKS
jgi:phosphatidylinositol-3-phosphatase